MRTSTRVSRRSWILAALSLGLQLTQGAASFCAAETRFLETETSLGPAPEKPFLTIVSPDGRRVAAIVRSKNWKQSVLSSLSLWGLQPSSAPARILVDGVFSPEYRLIAAPTFSPDGKRFAYLAMLPTDQFQGARPKNLPPKIGPFQVVVNGEAGSIWPIAVPPIASNQFVFSPDSEQLIFQVLKQVPNADWAMALMVNHVETEIFSGLIYRVVFSSDGERRALVTDKGDQRVVIVDGQERGRHAGIGALTFSPDGKRLAYVAARGERRFIVVDETEFRQFTRVWSPVFSPDGQHIAYWAKDGKDKVMMLDDHEMGRGEFLAHPFTREVFRYALGPVFSPDSRRLAYVLKKDKDSTLTIGDTKQVFRGALPFGLSFSSDAKRFAYCLFKDNEEMLYAVVDSEEFSTGFHEANRIGLLSGLGPSRMAVPKFSPDGQHFAYLRTKRPKRWWKDGPNLQVVIDGLGSSFFESVIEMGWENSTTLWAVVQRGNEYLRVELQLPRALLIGPTDSH